MGIRNIENRQNVTAEQVIPNGQNENLLPKVAPLGGRPEGIHDVVDFLAVNNPSVGILGVNEDAGILVDLQPEAPSFISSCKGGECVINLSRPVYRQSVENYIESRSTKEQRIQIARTANFDRFMKLNRFYEVLFNIPENASDEDKQQNPDLANNIGAAATRFEEINTLLDMGDPSSITYAEEMLTFANEDLSLESMDLVIDQLTELRNRDKNESTTQLDKKRLQDDRRKEERERVLRAKKDNRQRNLELAHGVRRGKKVAVREDIKAKKQSKSSRH